MSHLHTDQGKRITFACPHCGGAMRTRSSRAVTPLVRQMILRCIDDDCAVVFGGDQTLTHTISPSKKPREGFELRQAPPRRSPANDDVPARHDTPGGAEVPPANDDDLLIASG